MNTGWLRDLGLPPDLTAALIVFLALTYWGSRWLDVILKHNREKLRITAEIDRKARQLAADLAAKMEKVAKRERNAIRQTGGQKAKDT